MVLSRCRESLGRITSNPSTVLAHSRRRSIPDEIASAWTSSVVRLVITFSWTFAEPRWLTQSESSSSAALMAIWFRSNNSRVSAVVEACSSISMLQIRSCLGIFRADPRGGRPKRVILRCYSTRFCCLLRRIDSVGRVQIPASGSRKALRSYEPSCAIGAAAGQSDGDNFFEGVQPRDCRAGIGSGTIRYRF